jgi:hypothetical protein
MRFSKSIHRISFSALLAVIVCGAIVRGLARRGDADWGKPANGLQISISRVNDAGKPNGLGMIQINLHNSSKKDLYTIPGMLQDACEPRSLVRNFKITMTDSKGIVWRIAPRLDGITCDGNTEPFVLPLPAGTTFSIPIDMNGYSDGGADGTGSFARLSMQLKPGEFSIQAEFTGKDVEQYDDLRLDEMKRADGTRPPEVHMEIGAAMEAWRGTAKSNKLQISFSADELSKKYKDGW